MKNIANLETIIIIIILTIIFFYLCYKKKQHFSLKCPYFCHDADIFYNMASCANCYIKGGKYEKTEEELNKSKILLLPPHSEDCPGICKNESYRYGVCSKCFKPGGIFENIKEDCGDYCNKFSSKTGRCKSCFEIGGRLHSDNKKKEIKNCISSCNENSYRYGICASCFETGGKYANIKEPCYESCTEFSSKNGRCSNCFKIGGRFYKDKNYKIPEAKSEYVLYTPPEIPKDLSPSCPHYCTEKSNKTGSCKSCFEKGGYYEGTEELCHDYCNKFSNPNASCKPCFKKGGKLYVEPLVEPSPIVQIPKKEQTIIPKLYTPPPPPQDHSDGCHWYCNENSYPLGNCSKCFKEDGAFYETTKKCLNFCTKIDKDLDLCKPCFKIGERLYNEPKPVIVQNKKLFDIPIQNPPNCAEWCNNKNLFYNKNYDKYCIKDITKLGKNCYSDRTHIPPKIIYPQTCKCDNGVADKNVDCAKDTTLEKCLSCYPGSTLDSHNKCILNNCICDNGTPYIGVNCPNINKHKCLKCNEGYILIKDKCYKRFNEYDDGIKNKYDPIENKGYFNLIEDFQDYSTLNNYIDPTDGGPVTEDENMSVAKVKNANTLKSCKENCNIFDTCGGIAYKNDSSDECYTMSTSQKWLSRNNPDNLNGLWTTFKRLNPDVPPLPDLIEGEQRKIQYFRHKPNIEYNIRFNQNVPYQYNYNIDISNGEYTNDISKSTYKGTVENCKKKCKSLDNCGGFSYNKINNTCTLKNNNLSTLSLPQDNNYDTYSKMNITGTKPEYPSCPINCGEQTKENILRDNFIIDCIRPQNAGKNCLKKYPNIDLIIQNEIDKLYEFSIKKQKEANKAIDQATGDTILFNSLLLKSENAILTQENAADKLKTHAQKELQLTQEEKAYLKAVEGWEQVYDDLITTIDEKLLESEKKYNDRVKKRAAEVAQRQLVWEEEQARKAREAEEAAEKLRLKILEEKKRELQLKKQKIEEDARKERERVAEALKEAKQERDRLKQQKDIAAKKAADAAKKAASAAEVLKKSNELAAKRGNEAYFTSIQLSVERLQKEAKVNQANTQAEKANAELKKRESSETLSKNIQNLHNSHITTKNTILDIPCTNCSTDGKCGNIINKTCNKPCCTRNGKPQYCSNYGFCGPEATGQWSNKALYENSKNSLCDSKSVTCNDYNKQYLIPKTKIIDSTVEIAGNTLSTDVETIGKNLDKVHQYVINKTNPVQNTPKQNTATIAETNKNINIAKNTRDDTKKLYDTIYQDYSNTNENLKKEKQRNQIIELEKKKIEEEADGYAVLIQNTKGSLANYQEKLIITEQTQDNIVSDIFKADTLLKLEDNQEEMQRLQDIAFKKTQEKEILAASKVDLEVEINKTLEIISLAQENKVIAETKTTELKQQEREAELAIKAHENKLTIEAMAIEKLKEEKQKSENELKKYNEEKTEKLVNIYNIVTQKQNEIRIENKKSQIVSSNMLKAKTSEGRSLDFNILATGSSDHYKLESIYPDPEIISKEGKKIKLSEAYISTKYAHIATMALYNHLLTDYRHTDNNSMTKNFENLKFIKAQNISPYTGYDSSITGIEEINNDLKTLLNHYIDARKNTHHKFLAYNHYYSMYMNIIQNRKYAIENSGLSLNTLSEIVWPSKTSIEQIKLEEVSESIERALVAYNSSKNELDALKQDLLYKTKLEADKLSINQDAKACKYTNITKKLNSSGDLVCCNDDKIDKDGNCCHLQELDCMGVCGGKAGKISSTGVCGGLNTDPSMSSENTYDNNFNRNLGGTQNSFNSNGGDTRTDAEKKQDEKENLATQCICPNGYPHGMIFNDKDEPIGWGSAYDTTDDGCTPFANIKCAGHSKNSIWRHANGDIKNYCKDGFIPETAEPGSQITQKHLEDSKFKGCKRNEIKFSCPNGISENSNYGLNNRFVGTNIMRWIPWGLKKPESGNEIINNTLSQLLAIKYDSFTEHELNDINKNYISRDKNIHYLDYIKSTNGIYFKPYHNNFPKNNNEINCKSCNEGYILKYNIPKHGSCDPRDGCPSTRAECIIKPKECACYNFEKYDDNHIKCTDGAFRLAQIDGNYSTGYGNNETSRVGKCKKCYIGKGPWNDRNRGGNPGNQGIVCKYDSDCSAEWIGKWDNMPKLNNLMDPKHNDLKPNVKNKNIHKESTHQKKSKKPYTHPQDYTTRINQDSAHPYSKAYGRNYKCVKSSSRSETGVCCFGTRPIDESTMQGSMNGKSSYNCTRNGQMKCNAPNCGKLIRYNFSRSSDEPKKIPSGPSLSYGKYNPDSGRCNQYHNQTKNTYPINNEKEFNDSHTIDPTGIDKSRDKWAVDKNGNFTNETKRGSNDEGGDLTGASFWNYDDGKIPGNILLTYN